MLLSLSNIDTPHCLNTHCPTQEWNRSENISKGSSHYPNAGCFLFINSGIEYICLLVSFLFELCNPHCRSKSSQPARLLNPFTSCCGNRQELRAHGNAVAGVREQTPGNVQQISKECVRVCVVEGGKYYLRFCILYKLCDTSKEIALNLDM